MPPSFLLPHPADVSLHIYHVVKSGRHLLSSHPQHDGRVYCVSISLLTCLDILPSSLSPCHHQIGPKKDPLFKLPRQWTHSYKNTIKLRRISRSSVTVFKIYSKLTLQGSMASLPGPAVSSVPDQDPLGSVTLWLPGSVIESSIIWYGFGSRFLLFFSYMMV